MAIVDGRAAPRWLWLLLLTATVPFDGAQAVVVGRPLWPLPRRSSNGTTTLRVQQRPSAAESFFSMASGQPGTTLAAAFQRYSQLTFPHHIPAAGGISGPTLSGPTLHGLSVTVDDPSEVMLQLGTDESYSLAVAGNGNNASLHAATVYGAVRGLETFSQLVAFDFDQHAYTLPNAPWAISDAPRFAHRGVMIDSRLMITLIFDVFSPNLFDFLPTFPRNFPGISPDLTHVG